MPPHRPPSPSLFFSDAGENDEDMIRSSPAVGAEAEAEYDEDAYAGGVARAGGRCEKKWAWCFSGTTDECHGQSYHPSTVPHYASLPPPSALSLPSRSLCLMFLRPRSGLRHGNRHPV
ncbi:hypothetical protein DFH09DRAFT_1300289 [Mycena vulgaris]|nr:hypothetical protein DFH09DRAFT_1300289 [Mycena vulgaris]